MEGNSWNIAPNRSLGQWPIKQLYVAILIFRNMPVLRQLVAPFARLPDAEELGLAVLVVVHAPDVLDRDRPRNNLPCLLLPPLVCVQFDKVLPQIDRVFTAVQDFVGGPFDRSRREFCQCCIFLIQAFEARGAWSLHRGEKRNMKLVESLWRLECVRG